MRRTSCHPVGARRQHLGPRRLGRHVDPERRGVLRVVGRLRQRQRMERSFLVEDRAADPAVGDEDEVPQRLGEGPLTIDPLVDGALGQPLGAGRRLRPHPLDGVPHRAEVVGRPDLPQLNPLGVAAVELGLDVVGHVDAVDHQPLDVARDVDAQQGGVDDLDPGQVAVDEPGAGEVADHEGGSAERLVVAVVVESCRPPVRTVLRCHRTIVTARTDKPSMSARTDSVAACTPTTSRWR